jgi:hypothetical protein
MLPVRVDAERRQAAEIHMGRFELEPADEIQRSEPVLIGGCGMKRVDRLGVDGDPRRHIRDAPLGLRRHRKHQDRTG